MLKLYLSQINPTIGDLAGNTALILQEYKKAQDDSCDLIIFSEMAITGYPAEDLWQKKYFIKEAQEKITEIIAATRHSNCAILLGGPHLWQKKDQREIISNAAYFIEDGEVKRIIHKKSLPNYGVFDEKRYFEAENFLSYHEFRGQTLALLICEDFWDYKNIFLLQEQIFDAVIVINASPYSSKKHLYRQQITKNFSQKINKPLIYLNQVGGQDSLVFDGSSFAVDENGKIALRMNEFTQDSAIVNLEKGKIASVRSNNNTAADPFDILQRDYSACVLGVRDYIQKNGFTKVMLGMSGGVDSALVAVMAVDALGPENVYLYALPTRFNSETSLKDAQDCANKISCKLQLISIESVFETMQYTLNETLQNEAKSEAAIALAKENLQSRIRANILMAISNASGAVLITTGNKSEMATGYATLYGDMCGAFNPLKDVYKTHVYDLVKWRNDNIPAISLYQKANLIPANIITKAPSAELREDQKDSDSLPEYDILDKILFALIEEKKSVAEVINQGFDEETVKKVATLFYRAEFKRRQAVIGPKISDMAFDKDRRYPITNKYTK